MPEEKYSETNIDDWLYVIRDDNTINLVRYMGLKTNIIIPNNFVINDINYSITEISATALSYNNVEKVIVSEGIKLIE